MELKEVVRWLLSQGYGVMVGGEFVQTRKLNDELKGLPLTGSSQPALTPVNRVENTKKEIWNKFIADAEVPYRVSSSIGMYTVRQFNVTALNKLMKILADPSIDYNTFVASTKNYYKNMTGRTTLSRYLTSDLWRDEYDEYVKNPKGIPSNDGSSRWED